MIFEIFLDNIGHTKYFSIIYITGLTICLIEVIFYRYEIRENAVTSRIDYSSEKVSSRTH